MTQPPDLSSTSQTQTLTPPAKGSSPAPSALIRLATELDAPDVWDLADTYRDAYRTDYNMDGLTALVILERIQEEKVLVAEYKGSVIAAFYADNFHQDDLYAEIHFLMYPRYWVYAVKSGLFPSFINAAFEQWPVGKFKASMLPRQKTSRWLFDRLKFRYVGTEFDETKVDGIAVNLLRFELKKTFWQRNNK